MPYIHTNKTFYKQNYIDFISHYLPPQIPVYKLMGSIHAGHKHRKSTHTQTYYVEVALLRIDRLNINRCTTEPYTHRGPPAPNQPVTCITWIFTWSINRLACLSYTLSAAIYLHTRWWKVSNIFTLIVLMLKKIFILKFDKTYLKT